MRIARTRSALVHILGRTNVLLGFLNLIPVLPWDGGQALQALLGHRTSEFRAMRTTAHIGLVVAALLLVYAIFEGGFFRLFALGSVFKLVFEPHRTP